MSLYRGNQILECGGVPTNGVYFESGEPTSASVQTMEWKLLADTTSATIPSGAKEIYIICYLESYGNLMGSCIFLTRDFYNSGQLVVPVNSDGRIIFNYTKTSISFASGTYSTYKIYYR